MAKRVTTTATADELRAAIRKLPAILAGKSADVDGIAHGFQLRLAVAWLQLVKLAFITKSNGGTDEAGDSWHKLSKPYLAYQRGHTSRKPPQMGGKAPGRTKGKQHDGGMSDAQLAQWRGIYASTAARLAPSMGAAAAQGRAAAIAWGIMKARGVKTKLEVFGNRQVSILRDRGILFNSIQPGVVSGGAYSPPDGQIIEQSAGQFAVGTNIEYAAAHHFGKGKRRRRLWPEPHRIPEGWWREMTTTATRGLEQAAAIIARSAA